MAFVPVFPGVLILLEPPIKILILAVFLTSLSSQLIPCLIVQGTATEKIRFTSSEESPAGGDWGFIQFDDGSNGVINNAVIEYAGYMTSSNYSYDGAAIYAFGGSLSLKIQPYSTF